MKYKLEFLFFGDDYMYKKVQRDLISEQVYEYIKNRIINNELRPNEKIEVVQVAEDLGVSRTPVASALNRLRNDGYVTILPQSGTFVRDHSSSELYIIFKCRAGLEKAIVETYGETLDRNELLRIRSAFVTIANDSEDAGTVQEKLFAVDLQFHAMLIASCAEVIRSSIISIADLTKRSRLLYFKLARDRENNMIRINRNIQMHCNIIDMILAGQYEIAGQMVYDDIIFTYDSIKNFV